MFPKADTFVLSGIRAQKQGMLMSIEVNIMTNEKLRNKAKTSSSERVSSYPALKRALDIFFSYILLCAAYLPMLFIAVAIKLTSPGKVIFKQIRVGKDGRNFVCYKFRTMREDAPKNMPTSQFCDAERYITPVGRFLRRTSLDELPQLFNVICGDMSLVGPRPLIPEESDIHQKRNELGVYSLRPGITGLAQTHGRDMISDDEKLTYDSEYTKNLCLWQDVKILSCTFIKVFAAEGIKDAAKQRSEHP